MAVGPLPRPPQPKPDKEAVAQYESIPDPKQLRVIKRLCALLEQMNPDNTYTDAKGLERPFPVDLRGKVFRGRLTVTTEEAQDALSILENPRPSDLSAAGFDLDLAVGDKVLLLQGWPRDNIFNPSDHAYKLGALAEQRLARVSKLDRKGDPMYPDDYMLGVDSEGDQELTEFSIGQLVVRPPGDANSRLSMFFIPVVVRLAANHSNPFL
jgi:hypothetical protein